MLGMLERTPSRSTSASTRTRRASGSKRMSAESGDRRPGRAERDRLRGRVRAGDRVAEKIGFLADDGSSEVRLPEAPLLGVLPGTGGSRACRQAEDPARPRRCVLHRGRKGWGKRAVGVGTSSMKRRRRRSSSTKRRSARLSAMVARSKRGRRSSRSFSRRSKANGTREATRVEYKVRAASKTAIRRAQGDADRAGAQCVAGAEPQTPDGARQGAGRNGLGRCARLPRARRRGAARPPLQPARHRRGGALKTSRAIAAAVLAVDEDARQAQGRRARARSHAPHAPRLEAPRRHVEELSSRSFDVGSLLLPARSSSSLLASDRVYMLDVDGVAMHVSPMNAGPASRCRNGLTRLQSRFLREPERWVSPRARDEGPDRDAPMPRTRPACVTFAPDDIDWDDEIRIAFEERVSMSPDAMTGMEASSSASAAPETMETKIFGRLSGVAKLDFPATERRRRARRAQALRPPRAPRVRLAKDLKRS